MTTLQTLLILVGTAALSQAECPEEYKKLTTDHTMCLTDKGVDIPVTDAVRNEVVARHNAIRAEVSPAAGNMLELVWNTNLAAVAAKWARQCRVDHDTYKQREEPSLPGLWIGQNAAGGSRSLLVATNNWYSEKVNFTYGTFTNKINGHYTQIIFANTALIGCGEADCSGVGLYDRVQICNYAPGQIGANVATQPYVSSTTACSECSKCDTSGKLCDCSGIVCFNGGTFNVSTCKCECSAAFSGNNCETKNCLDDTDWKCKLYFKKYTKEVACTFQNVKEEECPNKCGFC